MPFFLASRLIFLGCRAVLKKGPFDTKCGAQPPKLETIFWARNRALIEFSYTDFNKGVFFEGPFSGLAFRVRGAAQPRRVHGQDFLVGNDFCARLLYGMFSTFLYGLCSSWHPNRVLFAIIIFSNDCHKVLLFVADVEASSQMPCRPWRIGWRSAALQRHANSRLRIEVPGDMYRRIVSILIGSSIRAVIKATGRLWEELSMASKNSWRQLAELFKHREVQKCAQEFLPSYDRNRNRTFRARQALGAQEKVLRKRC